MSLLDVIKSDIQKITTNTNEFAVEMDFITPQGVEYLALCGLHTKHHLGLDAELQKWVNSKNAHISVPESEFIRVSYPLRVNREVTLLYHKVRVKDSTGNVRLYNVDQWFPNETIGLITCILGTEKES